MVLLINTVLWNLIKIVDVTISLRYSQIQFYYIFWPDLARCHYFRQTVAWMDENVNFVPKEINPPNVPQARPIENFWDKRFTREDGKLKRRSS